MKLSLPLASSYKHTAVLFILVLLLFSFPVSEFLRHTCAPQAFSLHPNRRRLHLTSTFFHLTDSLCIRRASVELVKPFRSKFNPTNKQPPRQAPLSPSLSGCDYLNCGLFGACCCRCNYHYFSFLIIVQGEC